MRLPIPSLTMVLISAMPILASAQATQRVDQRVITLREATLKPGVRGEDFERFFADSEAGPVNRNIPGMRTYLLKGERGARISGYVIVYEFDSLGRRNEYFPRPDTTSTRWQQLARALPANAHANLARYVDIRDYTDYVIAK
jgi:hypothetical protein